MVQKTIELFMEMELIEIMFMENIKRLLCSLERYLTGTYHQKRLSLYWKRMESSCFKTIRTNFKYDSYWK